MSTSNENIASQQEQKPKKGIAKILIPIAIILVVIFAAVVVFAAVNPSGKYNEAVALMSEDEYEDAIEIFESLNGYKDSEKKIEKCEEKMLEALYEKAEETLEKGKYEKALELFEECGDYEDAQEMVEQIERMLDDQESGAIAEEPVEVEPAPEETVPETTEPVQQGNQVGDLCYGYDLEIVTGEGVSTETIDPTATGKITVINFWGTWCTPCVNELPYFDQIAINYPDDVTVIAVHTNSINETAPGYIAEHYPDSSITFARDYLLEGAEGYYTTLGGRGTYPYTVILDENGVIVEIFLKSLHYEDLEEVVESLLAS